MKFSMRNDLVLIRKQKRGIIRGLHMPEQSAEGMDFFVEGIGPDVEGLQVGMQVMIMGKSTEPFYPVPGNPHLLVCDQKLVAYVIEKDNDS